MATDDSFLTSGAEAAFAGLHLHSLLDAAPGQPHLPTTRPVRQNPALWQRQPAERLRTDPPGGAAALAQPVLRNTLRHINENLDSRLTWEQIASAVGMNHFRLGRAFRLCTGMTLHQYVTQCRIRRARHLLMHGQIGLADVALEVGFSCQSYLTTQFRKHTGLTPGAFRRAAARGEARSTASEV